MDLLHQSLDLCLCRRNANCDKDGLTGGCSVEFALRPFGLQDALAAGVSVLPIIVVNLAFFSRWILQGLRLIIDISITFFH